MTRRRHDDVVDAERCKHRLAKFTIGKNIKCDNVYCPDECAANSVLQQKKDKITQLCSLNGSGAQRPFFAKRCGRPGEYAS